MSTSIDPYAICPCGNGKKIKFCKCQDSVGLLDSVATMIEGGQVVPALDKLSSILTDNPDAAWAYAIRGRLLINLREYDSLAENAERFVRLQPSNPLALTQRAAASVFKGRAEEATTTMLEALTESGRNVDSFVLDISTALAFALAQNGSFLTARVYAMLPMMANGYEGERMAISVLQQLNQSTSINQLMKSIPMPISRPEDVSWGERFDEATTLLTNNQVLLAKDKFESLQKTVPNEPAILSGLLTCSIWRGDLDDQVRLLKKLSGCESLDLEQRIRYRAVSALAKPGSPELAVASHQLLSETANVEEAEMAMMANSRFIALPAEMLADFRLSEDDIPPRSGFQILDREAPEDLEKIPDPGALPESLGLVLIYGKQTDREARIEVVDLLSGDVDEIRKQMESTLNGVKLEDGKTEPSPFLSSAQPKIGMIRFKVSAEEAEAMQKQWFATRMPEVLCSLNLPILGGQSLSETKDNVDLLIERSATLRVIEHYEALVSELGESLSAVYAAAGVQQPEAIMATDDDIETLDTADLLRVDVSNLSSTALMYLVQRAQQISSNTVAKVAAKRLLEMDLPEEEAQTHMLAHLALINAVNDSREAIECIDKAKIFAAKHSMSSANLLLSEIPLRLRSGDSAGFQAAIGELTTNYNQEPEVMAQLQQILMAVGLLGPDGQPVGGPPPGAQAAPDAGPASAPGGLWTPEQGSPPPASEGSGSGKLWVPGMD